MYRNLMLLSLIAIPSMGRAQALYNNGATLNITSGTTLYVAGNLTNDATATINNSGVLEVTGNITNNGTILGASNINFSGTSIQTVSGTSTLTAKNVLVNNAAGVTITTPLSVDGAMTFTSGILTATTSAAPVIFTANGTVSGTPTNASHINGYVRKLGTGAFVYPIGNTTNYQPLGVNLSANSTGLTALYNVADAGAAPYGTGGSSSTPLLFYNKREYWELSPIGTATGTVTVYFDTYNNIGIGNIANLRVAHKSSGQWLNEGGTATGTVTSGSVTSNSISTFSPFTLGSISANSPLPVQLLSFTGRAEGTANRLEWQTASEETGTTYTVQHSTSAGSFETIGTVKGTGADSYTFKDMDAKGSDYYRLHSTDASGGESYSAVVVVRRSAAGSAGIVTLAPQPATSMLSITNTDASLNGGTAVILNVQGREVSRFVVSASTSIDVSNWAAGMYLLRLPSGEVLRIVKK